MAQSLDELRNAQRNNVVVGTALQQDAEGNNTIHPRLEIDQLVADEDVCNLFLLALRELQYPELRPKNAPAPSPGWSWLEICAIHGRPFAAWNGLTQGVARLNGQIKDRDFDPDNADQDGYQKSGYCSHGSVLFPGWHRPYVTMMEQAVCLKIHELVNRYRHPRDRQLYREAAYRFRFPYLDPNMPRVLLEPKGSKKLEWRCGLPQILMTDVVMVRTWDDPDILIEIPNPLYDFRFPEVRPRVPVYPFNYSEPMAFADTWEWNILPAENTPAFYAKLAQSYVTPNVRTTRTPDLASGVTNHRKMQANWEERIASQGRNLYELYANPRTSYNEFATQEFWRTGRGRGPVQTAQQVEIGRRSIDSSAHDTVHSWAGKQLLEDRYTSFAKVRPVGHMWKLMFASYDPIFWLHHTNVDRVFAIWQKLHSGHAEEEFSQYLFAPTYASPRGFNETPDTPLLPFLRTSSPTARFWTSRTCRDTRDMGYTYAETVQGQELSIQDMTVTQLWERLNAKYLWLGEIGNPSFRPPSRALTGFPIDFGRNALKRQPLVPPTEALPYPRVFIDGADVFPDPAIRDAPHDQLRALRSVNPEQSGVDIEKRRTVDAPGADSTDLVDHTSFAAVINTNSVREWDVWLTCEKFSVNGNFYTFFYFDPSNTSPSQWPKARGYVGQIFNLANPVNAGCANCDAHAASGAMVSNCLNLTPALRKYLASPKSLQPLSLKTLGREHVIPFLTKYLQWRMIGPNDAMLQASDIGKFQIEVVSRIFHPPASAGVPGSWEPYEPAVEITAGKPGGATETALQAASP